MIYELLPRYRSHEEVVAVRITQIEWDNQGGAFIVVEGGQQTYVGPAFVGRHEPREGGYFVVQKGANGPSLSFLSPREFQSRYAPLERRAGQMDFSTALYMMRDGASVSREGWNSGGTWIALQRPDDRSKMTEPYIYKRTPEGFGPWPPTHADMLANDWVVMAIED